LANEATPRVFNRRCARVDKVRSVSQFVSVSRPLDDRGGGDPHDLVLFHDWPSPVVHNVRLLASAKCQQRACPAFPNKINKIKLDVLRSSSLGERFASRATAFPPQPSGSGSSSFARDSPASLIAGRTLNPAVHINHPKNNDSADMTVCLCRRVAPDD
jgi:hypothetical protein